MPEQLRKLAAKLRKEASVSTMEKTVKCAQVMQAAVGLDTLKKKLGLR